MTNPKRTEEDIKKIIIYTKELGVHGWVVEIVYEDGKRAEFIVDYGIKDQSMIALVALCIEKQLRGGQTSL